MRPRHFSYKESDLICAVLAGSDSCAGEVEWGRQLHVCYSSYVTSDFREKCTGSSTEFVSCYIKTSLPSCETSTAPVQRDVTMGHVCRWALNGYRAIVNED